MINKQKIRELLPHYVAVLVLMFAALFLVRMALGEIRFLVELVVVVVVVSLYRVAVNYLGVAPSSWER